MENIPVFDAIRSNGHKYFDFRKTLSPKYQVVWRDITLGYLAVVLFILLNLYLEKTLPSIFWMFIPLAGFMGGYIIAYIQLFCHEAVHYNLHPNKQKNDILANAFLFSLFGNDIKTSRERHWKHHYYLGTTKDPENLYFQPVSDKLILKILSGIHFLQAVVFPWVIQIKNFRHNKSNGLKIRSLLSGLLVHSVMVSTLLYFGYWQCALVWIISMTVFFPLISTVRQILEFRSEWADSKIDYTVVDHGKVFRIFGSSFFSRTFGGAGFNRKMLHYWDPEISYTRFRDMESFLIDCPDCWDDIQNARTSYFDTYLWLIR